MKIWNLNSLWEVLYKQGKRWSKIWAREIICKFCYYFHLKINAEFLESFELKQLYTYIPSWISSIVKTQHRHKAVSQQTKSIQICLPLHTPATWRSLYKGQFRKTDGIKFMCGSPIRINNSLYLSGAETHKFTQNIFTVYYIIISFTVPQWLLL